MQSQSNVVSKLILFLSHAPTDPNNLAMLVVPQSVVWFASVQQ